MAKSRINVVVQDSVSSTAVVEQPVGPRGPQGLQGPPGTAGTGNRFSQLFGDGVATVFEIAHGFATRIVTVQVVEEPLGAVVEPSVSIPDEHYVRIEFLNPPATNQFRVIVTT